METKERKPGLNIHFSSMIIGFLLAACLSLALGAASSRSEGPYQISANSDLTDENKGRPFDGASGGCRA